MILAVPRPLVPGASACAARTSPSIGVLLGGVGFAAAAVAITYRAWADTLVWARFDAECGQILLAPFAFVCLLYVRWHAAGNSGRAGWYAGPLMVGVGWAAWSAGFYHSHDLYWHIGALLMVVGAAISWLGAGTLIRFWPAFLVLAFLIPITGFGRQYVATPLQVVTARLTQELCEAAGMTVGRYGSVLRINGHEVAIAEACNGLRMVWPLFLATYLFAFITPMRGWLRATVLAASPAIAVSANVLRLVPTVWAYGHWSLPAASAFHDASGWVMLILAFFALIGVARALRWAVPPQALVSAPAVARPGLDADDHARARRSDAPTTQGERDGSRLGLGAAVAVTTLLLTGAAWEARTFPVEADAAPYHALVRTCGSQAPDHIGDWVGRDVPTPDDIASVLQPNLVICREYVDGRTGHRATVLLVQVTDARRIVWHAVTNCYPLAGWELLSQAPQDWAAGELTLKGSEYQFSRGSFQQSTSIAVADFMLLPDGRVARNMQLVRVWAEMADKRIYGAAHLQIVCDATLPKDIRDEIVRDLLTGYAPLVRVIGSGIPRP